MRAEFDLEAFFRQPLEHAVAFPSPAEILITNYLENVT